MACTTFKTGHHSNFNKSFARGGVDLKENKGKLFGMFVPQHQNCKCLPDSLIPRRGEGSKGRTKFYKKQSQIRILLFLLFFQNFNFAKRQNF